MRRTLTRKVIIREYDYNKVREEALHSADGITLYDRVSFMPLNQENLEKLKMLDILRGKKSTPLIESELDLKHPYRLVAELKDYLYSEKYYEWSLSVDDDGYLCVQSRKNTPKTRLGWGVFEKDLECRL